MLISTTDHGTQLYSLMIAPPWERLESQTYHLGKNDLKFLLSLRSGTRCDDVPAQEQRNLLDVLARFGLSQINDGAYVHAVVEPDSHGIATPAIDDNQRYSIRWPIVWEVTPQGFVCRDHDGDAGRVVSAQALSLAERFINPTSVAMLDSDQDIDETSLVLKAGIAELAAAGLLEPVVAHESNQGSAEVGSSKPTFLMYHARYAQRMEELRKIYKSSQPVGSKKIHINLVLTNWWTPPLALGMIMSHARVWNEGKLGESYELFPRWVAPYENVARFSGDPSVFLFSDYIWSHDINLELSRRIKSTYPNAVIIHGGPDCPTYRDDTERYFSDHPYVDIAVRGEGEETICEILDALAPGLLAEKIDLSVLQSVLGLSYRSRDGNIVLTAQRPRVTDLNVIPSPFLDGTFDVFESGDEIHMLVVETNRGCPYGCTFCDWGSATNSKIRQFDLERIFAELEWSAKNKVQQIFIADANFGAFARDVEISRHMAKLKKQYGYPQRFITNYAKNSVKYLRPIVEIISSAGILTEGLLSLQSMDSNTLSAIRRSNIKTEKYDELAAEFRANKLPLFVDLMMGLPGQTAKSLHNDLQLCVDKEVLAKCHGTELLVNSPMNDPVYRKEYAIEASRPPGPEAVEVGALVKPREASLVISSSSFSREDYHDMHRMRRTYLLCENLGVLRYLARYVRSRIGMPEVDFYESWRRTVQEDPWSWPVSSMTSSIVPSAMVPPVSWANLMAEMKRFCLENLALEPGSELDCALQAQHAVLPTPRRAFPAIVHLPHDFAAWHDAVLALKLGDHPTDWERYVPQLGTFGPAVLEVHDPTNVSNKAMAKESAIAAYVDWELKSDISRPTPGHHQM
ncbi:MAG: radical SAM protein [Halioglobus sp.]|nr:radical SAM protein [Halioglobus sp.]